MKTATQTVVYADENSEREYERLRKASNGDDRKVFAFMTRLREYLKNHYRRGRRVRRDKVPRVYAKLLGSNQLWELDYAGYGIIRYTVAKGHIKIVDVV